MSRAINRSHRKLIKIFLIPFSSTAASKFFPPTAPLWLAIECSMICRQIVCMLSTQRSSSCVCPGFAAKRAETALIEQAQKRAEHDGGPFRGKCCFFVVLLLFWSSPLFRFCSFAEFVVGTSSTAAANAPAPADAHWCISSTQSDSARNGSKNELHIKILNFELHTKFRDLQNWAKKNRIFSTEKTSGIPAGQVLNFAQKAGRDSYQKVPSVTGISSKILAPILCGPRLKFK